MEKQSVRRHDLDWLRVLAFFTLIFYHAGRPFVVNDPWHINNGEGSQLLTYLWDFMHTWRLPLLFMISGAGVWFAFRKRNGAEFLGERAKRLLLPLFFGTLVIVPPQMYYQRLGEGQVFSSYLDFYPHFFEGVFPSGNLTPNHLWFVMYLFVYCLAALPIFLLLKKNMGGITDRLATLLSARGGIYLAAWIIIPAMVLVRPYNRGLWFNWESIILAFSLFILGFLISSRQEIWNAIERQRHFSLAFAAGAYAIYLYMRYTPDYFYGIWSYRTASTFAILTLLLAILGYGKRHLGFGNRFLTYTNEAVYPFYILHQTFTVVVAYFVVPLSWGLWTKFAVVTAGTMLPTWICYHYMIRHFNPLRVLFGMRKRPQSDQTMSLTVPMVEVATLEPVVADH